MTARKEQRVAGRQGEKGTWQKSAQVAILLKLGLFFDSSIV